MERKFIKGKLNFGFCSSNIAGRHEFIRLAIIDETSRVQFIEIEVSPEAFARAAFGHRGEVDCTFEMRALDRVGKFHENKTELLPWTKTVNRNTINNFKGGRDDEEISPEIVKFLAKYEVDGWQASVRDVFNFHRYGDKGGVQVSFHRYVDQRPAKSGFGDEEWYEGRGIS